MNEPSSCRAEHVLGDDGPVAARMPDYRERPEQLAMARAVEAALTQGRHLVVEAGTGVGKSFAYLVPAMAAAAAGRGPVVIATHTIPLQEQLTSKDLPLLRAVLPWEVSCALVKGRSQYLCLRRLDMARDRANALFSSVPDLESLESVTAWSEITQDGSLSDFPGIPSRSVWDRVQAEQGNCLGPKCKTFGPCFYQKARRRMYNADVLVVNHHLFFADLALRAEGAGYLPPYRAVILDEAHHAEEVAGEFLGASVSSTGIEWVLDRLWNPATGRGLAGTLPSAGDLLPKLEYVREASRQFFGEVRGWLGDSTDGKRLGASHAFDTELPRMLAEVAGDLEAGLSHRSEEEDMEVGANAGRLLAHAAGLRVVLDVDDPEQVYWAEASGARKVALRAAPMDVGPALRDLLYSKVGACVFTSATLAVGGGRDFGWFRRRMGLTDAAGPCSADELALGSPFDYQNKVLLRLHADVPDPRQEDRYLSAVTDRVRRSVLETGGSAFVLFTNHRHLRRVHDALEEELSWCGIRALRQGADLPRGRLLAAFREGRAVLFGADSFWQGVDVPGEALTNVIITRLPFAAPGHPLVEARLERIRRRGGDPFMEYSLPQAVIRFRQGFGRLIRRHEDQGRVEVLDSRAVNRPYGRMFVDSLPGCRTEIVGR